MPDAPGSDNTGQQDHISNSAAVPMLDIDDPLVVAIFHAFETHDDEAVEAQDGDYTRGLARLAAHAVRQGGDGPDWRIVPDHVCDRDGNVWRVTRDGGMLTRAEYTGIVSIGYKRAEQELGPLFLVFRRTR